MKTNEPLEGRYLIRLGGTADERSHVEREAMRHGASVTHKYDVGFRGFAVRNLPEYAADALSKNPAVVQIEEVGVVRISADQSLTLSAQNHSDLWALDRIDQPSPTCARFDSIFRYCSTGEGVDVYVVDTGIRPDKPGFLRTDDTTRVRFGGSWVAGSSCWEANNFSGNASHGTAVASLVGGNTYGVAKNVTLVDVRAFDCGGDSDTATVNSALEWILSQTTVLSNGVRTRVGARAVVNLSFEFRASCSRGVCHPPSMVLTIGELVAAGIPVVGAAGNHANDGEEASTTYNAYPSSISDAIIVAGSNKYSDTHWQYSNFGPTVDFYAPAQYVESDRNFPYDPAYASPAVTERRSSSTNCSSHPQDTCTSGTSFASPLVAGAVARYLQMYPGADMNSVLQYLGSESATGTGTTVIDPSGRSVPLANISDCGGTC